MNQVATNDRPANPLVQLSGFLDKLKPQMALALPKHLTPDRMARLALTAFSTTPKLQECSSHSIAGSIMTAATLGLEPGVNGQGYLIPYGQTCTFVPGWKGLVDIANRAGRGTVWTGAVYDGDEFEYALGDRPFIIHRPGDGDDDPNKLLYTYAVGRVNGSEWPVLEVWSTAKTQRHRDKYNKVGNKHYSYRDWEMYARKVPLLQVLKYMPSSIELSNALAAANAAERGLNATIDIGRGFVNVSAPDDEHTDDDGVIHGKKDTKPAGDQRATYPDDKFAAEVEKWKALIITKKKTAAQIIAMAETKHPLSEAQKAQINAVKVPRDDAPKFERAEVEKSLDTAKTRDALDTAATNIEFIPDEKDRAALNAKYEQRCAELELT